MQLLKSIQEKLSYTPSHNPVIRFQLLVIFAALMLSGCNNDTEVVTDSVNPSAPAVPVTEQNAQAVIDQPVDLLEGTFEDGTRWAIARPANYNGMIVLDLDGANFMTALERQQADSPDEVTATTISSAFSGFNAWLLESGYAYGGITREPVGYDFPQAVEMMIQVRQQVTDAWGAPQRTLSVGVSRGGFATRKALELYPDIFDGAVVAAGGGAGEIAVLNNKLNALFVLKTLVDPNAPLSLVNIDAQAENQALGELVTKARSSQEGQARLVLASAVIQFATWTNGRSEKPAADDYEAQLEQMASAWGFAIAVPVRAGVERIAGGNVSWNTGVDYTELLARSGRRDMVEYFYNQAGISLEDDLQILADAPRISADPAAVAKAEPLMTYSGDIRSPIVNVDNDDPVDPLSDKLAYRNLLQQQGKGDLLQILWSDTAGHVGMSNLDRAVGFQLLEQRLATGAWPDNTVSSLQTMADSIAGESAIELGNFTLFEPQDIPEPASTWDGTDWGTYRAE